MDVASRHYALPPFHRYGNQTGRSGVAGYALVGNGIAVRFVDGSVYLYDRDCPGPLHVSRMKQLAREGAGLSTYISRRVGQRYATRLDTSISPSALARAQDTRRRRVHRASTTDGEERAQSSTRQNTAFR
jgi:hypothetical protein